LKPKLAGRGKVLTFVGFSYQTHDIMAFRITFFKMPKPRRFTYSPIFYDPVKERIEEARARVAQEKEEKARTPEERPYLPGQRIRGAFQKAQDDRRRPTGHSQLIRVVLLLTLAILFVFIWYFTDGLTMLFKALNQSTP
jgi:hypothetical protein